MKHVVLLFYVAGIRLLKEKSIVTLQSMSEYAEIPAEQKKEYVNYAERLQEALRLYDLANARYQRAPQVSSKDLPV